MMTFQIQRTVGFSLGLVACAFLAGVGGQARHFSEPRPGAQTVQRSFPIEDKGRVVIR